MNSAMVAGVGDEFAGGQESSVETAAVFQATPGEGCQYGKEEAHLRKV